MSTRAGILVLVLIVGAALAGGFVVWSWHDGRQRALAVVRRDLDQGLFARAWRTLSRLTRENPDWDDALYFLGVCEQARGRGTEAAAAFARIQSGSPWLGWALVRRSRIELEHGQLTQAEQLLKAALASDGDHQAEARWGLVLLLRMEGRFWEARRLLEDGFGRMSSAVETLRRLYKLDVEPFPVEGVKRGLERSTVAESDDRVWLARAHVAIREGDFTAARRLLARCLEKRGDDRVVWRMKLELGLAADDDETVIEALPHLLVEHEPPGRPYEILAWLARRRGDRKAEQRALQALLELEPGDGAAIERLAAILHESGETERARELRRRLRELELARDAYIHLLALPSPEERAEELADQAERLGRRFDANCWRTLGSVPARGVAMTPGQARWQPGTTLADAIPEEWKRRNSAKPDPKLPAAVPLHFEDAAASSGLTFEQKSGGGSGGLIPPVTASGGVGLLDYDRDGFLDVYLVQGGVFPPSRELSRCADRLFRNRGDGTFEDVSERTGIAAMPGGYGHGVAVADYDGDGWPDLFVTRYRSYALYRNQGNGSFQDVTDAAGLGGDRDWPTSAAFADLDADGDLDLYVCHYMQWDETNPRSCSDPHDPTIYRCLPLDFPALPDHLFRNDKGRFVDITAQAGIRDPNGRGLGVLAADLDRDGKVDLFVANDMTANYLWKNQGGFHFQETALEAGVACNASGGFQAGMGVACGDYDGDLQLDLAVTNFYNESTSLFRNLGDGIFTDQTSASGLGQASRYLLGFGVSFLDADNDGVLDLITANGHVHDGRPRFAWQMPIQLLRGDGRGRLIDQRKTAGAPFSALHMGRGLATGDLDNDGRTDVVVVSEDEPVIFLRNLTRGGRFLSVRLEGTRSNRDGVGAVVKVTAGGRRWVHPRLGGGSYQSACDPRIHLGLGASPAVDELEIVWPSGQVDRFHGLPADKGYLIREGGAAALPDPGWPPHPHD